MEEKQRIIQEFVPGKQVPLAHVITNPEEDLYKKLGISGFFHTQQKTSQGQKDKMG